jgi:hypothetical protein
MEGHSPVSDHSSDRAVDGVSAREYHRHHIDIPARPSHYPLSELREIFLKRPLTIKTSSSEASPRVESGHTSCKGVPFYH